MSRILYKYLDIKGGEMMLGNNNLQFTNATQLNDPFDCHPKLMDYSNAPDALKEKISRDTYRAIEEYGAYNLRNNAWLCSLSKNNDSILMWSHYCYNHKGICIGLDMDKVMTCVPKMGAGCAIVNPLELEVNYRDIIERPDRRSDHIDFFLHYQLRTKAKEWEYEKEVRLVILNPRPELAMLSPEQAKSKRMLNRIEIRHYLPLSGDCFESIYFGINTAPEEKEKIIQFTRTKLNTDIKLYQMTIDENAFRLKAEEIK